MKRGDLFLVLFLLFTCSIFASQSKVIKKSFAAEAGKTIEFENFSGVDLKVTAWDKNEIGIYLKVRVESSDNDFEKKYAESLDVTNEILGSRQLITLEKTDDRPGTSILGLFKVSLFSNFSSEIKGEIYLPAAAAVSSLTFNYSDVIITGLKNIEDLSGKSSTFKIYGCGIKNYIDDDYGRIEMEKCSGNLQIRSKSSTIEITDHAGGLEINSDYTDLRILNATGKVSVRNKSGDIEIKNAPVQFLDIDYSGLEITDSNIGQGNTLKIRGKSSKYNFNNVTANFQIESDYTEAYFSGIKGNIYYDGKSCTIKGNDVSGNIEIKSEYTGIEFHRLSSKNITVNNNSNSIDLFLVSEPENIEIHNKYGNVNIEMPRSYDGEIDLRTHYGQIINDFETDTRTDKSVITAYTKGKSPKKKIRIENYSGDISLRH